MQNYSYVKLQYYMQYIIKKSTILLIFNIINNWMYLITQFNILFNNVIIFEKSIVKIIFILKCIF